MRYSTSYLLLAAAAATSASANVAIPAAVVPKRGMVQARQTDAPTSSSSSSGDDDLDAACASTADVIETSMPTAPSDLLDYYDTYTYTDSCLVIPSSLKSEWDDYTTSLVSWSSANRDDLSTFLAGCTDYELDLISDYCTTDAAARGGSGTAAATATPTSDDDADDAEETGSSSDASSGTKTSGGDEKSGGDKTTSGGDKATHTANVAVAREVGVVGAVVAGVLGMAVAL